MATLRHPGCHRVAPWVDERGDGDVSRYFTHRSRGSVVRAAIVGFQRADGEVAERFIVVGTECVECTATEFRAVVTDFSALAGEFDALTR